MAAGKIASFDPRKAGLKNVFKLQEENLQDQVDPSQQLQAKSIKVVVAVAGLFPYPCWLVLSVHGEPYIFAHSDVIFNFFPNLKFDWIKLDRDLFKYQIRCLGLKRARSYEFPPLTSKPSSGWFFTVVGPRKCMGPYTSPWTAVAPL